LKNYEEKMLDAANGDPVLKLHSFGGFDAGLAGTKFGK